MTILQLNITRKSIKIIDLRQGKGEGGSPHNASNRNSRPFAPAFTATPSSDPTTQSAVRNSSTDSVPSTAITRHPAAFPAPTPEDASSTTTHSPGKNPSSSAPFWYGSGSGFPRSTISPLIILSGNGNPPAVSRASSNRRLAEVTIAHRSSGRLSSSVFTPGNTRRSATSSTSRSSITFNPASASISGRSSLTISIARRP